MNTLARSLALVLLATFMSSCASAPGGMATGQASAPLGTTVQVGPSPGAPQPAAAPEAVVDEQWPRVVLSHEGETRVYQPQVDSWDGSLLKAHAAVFVKPPDGKPPTFGVIWVTVRTQVDRGTRLVTLTDGRVVKANFPSAPGKEQAYVGIIEPNVLHERVMGLDRLEAALAVHQAQRKSDAVPPRNDPPVIVFSMVPAILVLIDGPPAYRAVSETTFHRIINTRPLILRASGGTHYLHVFDGWMEAPALQGPWTVVREAPPDLATAEKAATASQPVDLLPGGDPKDPNAMPSLARGPAPHIVVATTPTELVVIEGLPDYFSISGTDLMYVNNTTGHVFQDLRDQMTYVLISGRWFRSPTSVTMSGPWTYVPGAELPADFALIPDDSPKENVKASVPGTPQAEEARIANSISQTVTIQRSQTKMAPPPFDGPPRRAPIPGTPLQYVVNTATPIIILDAGSSYALQNGVWFVATSLDGPWGVATSVPAVIYTIPPSSPMHYVTYARVYDWTAQTVSVGYTPGYYGTYVDPDGVVVYGTGYDYTPWIGTVWYGPPETYGVAAALAYTPWTGWAVGFGFGWAWGATTGDWGWGVHPWWGPMGWAYGAAWGPHGGAAWGPGGWAATTGNVYRRWGSTTAVTRASAGFNAWTGSGWANQVGASYNSRTGTLAAGQRAAVGDVSTGNYAHGGRGAGVNTQTGAAVSAGRITVGNLYTGQSASATRAQVYNPRTGQTSTWDFGRSGDDFYAGHDGNVYQHDANGGWQRYGGGDGGGWSRAADSPTTAALDNDWAGRFNGSQRFGSVSSNFNDLGGRFGGGGFRFRR